MHWYHLIGLLLLPIVCDAQRLENPIMTDTSVMGTPKQPTIEGGWVNQAGKNGQMHEANKSVDQPVTLSKIADEFGSDKAIKKLLILAAHQNKLAYVLQKSQKMQLPATVALIPMVESGYQTDALSPKGASGAWQLMPATAKDYGLASKDRENFIASTDAALHLLKKLHQQFGHWTLTFAAYHAGSSRVLRALQRHPQAQLIDELGLPLETQRYIDRLKQLYQAMTK
jgi:hypothetical protein